MLLLENRQPAQTAVLVPLPAHSGLTAHIHGTSGRPEGSWAVSRLAFCVCPRAGLLFCLWEEHRTKQCTVPRAQGHKAVCLHWSFSVPDHGACWGGVCSSRAWGWECPSRVMREGDADHPL